MSFIGRFSSIFTAPTRVFDDIREGRVGWKQPWLMVSILYMIITYLGLPIQRAVMEINPGNLPPETLDQQIEMMDKLGFVWVLLAPIGILLVTLVVSGVSYILVTIMSQRATFKQYLTLSFFTDIIAMLGQLIAVIVVRMRGVDQIMGVEDARVSLSLRMLAPADSAVMRGLLGSFEFFVLWSFVVLVMGLTHIFGMSRAQAIAVLIPIWIIYVGMLIAGEVFGGMG